MSTPHLIQTICEILVAAFLIWGLFNEQKLIDFEDKIVAKWKAKKSKKFVPHYTEHSFVALVDGEEVEFVNEQEYLEYIS